MGLASRASTRISLSYDFTTSCLNNTSAAYGRKLQYCCKAFAPIESTDMSPPLKIHSKRHKQAFAVPATPNALQQTTDAVTNAMRLIVMLLGAVTLSLIIIWLLARVRLRLRRHRRNKISCSGGYEAIYPPTSSSMLVLESDISIDMIADDRQTQSSGTEFDDLSEQGSMETIVSSASATRATFGIENLPGLIKGSMLERRGRKDLSCNTSGYYEANMIATGTGPLSGRMSAKRSVTRPVFGFNFQEITPPVGSPLWNRKMDIPRPVRPGPLTHPPKFA